MDDIKLTKEINRAIRLSFFFMSLVMIVVTIVSFLMLQGNEFNSFENTFARSVKNNAPYFANEIFLEQMEALDLRIQEIISTTKDQYPNTKICLEVNSIHKKNATPKQIAFRCHQDLLSRDLTILHEIKLGENIMGNIRYNLVGEGFLENKLFRFIIIALTLAIIITFFAQYYFGKKLTNKFIIPLIRKVIFAEDEAEKYGIMKKLVHDSEAFIVILENLINKKGELSKDEKNIGMGSLSRIRLLHGAALRGASLSSQKELVRLEGFLESILAEKRIQFQEEGPLSLRLKPLKFDYFVNIEQVNFMRAISNLIDNAVEAIEDKTSGVVSICLHEIAQDTIKIIIQDNGKGIPQDILSQIQFNPFSYGKKDGNGIGLKNAMDIIKNNNGQLEIKSELGVGTAVTITLPYIKRMGVSKLLYLNFSHNIVILDDTIEIHETWKNIFYQIDFPRENLHLFSKIADFKQYCNKNLPTKFFIDYDLNSIQNGFDLIKELSLKNAFLVTSYSNDTSLIENCEKEEIKIISKKDIGSIQFEKLPKNFFVHLDDSSLLRKDWCRQAQEVGLEILSFESSEKLFDNLAIIPKQTQFFIDKNINEDIDGLEVCKKLFKFGYHQLFISTAEIDVDLTEYHFVKKVVDKKFPKHANF